MLASGLKCQPRTPSAHCRPGCMPIPVMPSGMLRGCKAGNWLEGACCTWMNHQSGSPRQRPSALAVRSTAHTRGRSRAVRTHARPSRAGDVKQESGGEAPATSYLVVGAYGHWRMDSNQAWSELSVPAQSVCRSASQLQWQQESPTESCECQSCKLYCCGTERSIVNTLYVYLTPLKAVMLLCRYKLALIPMGDYVFVLSQFQTFGYCLVYFSFLAARYRWALLHRV